jgi:hypothetical protein
MRMNLVIAAMAMSIAMSANAATISAELADRYGLVEMESSHFDDVYMVISDHRDAGIDWDINDRFHNRQDAKRLFSSWANSLARQLDL